MSSSFIDQALSSFSTQVDGMKSDLRVLDVELIDSTEARRRRLGRSKSFIYVWLSASLEDFCNSILSGITQELETLNHPPIAYKPGLIALCYHNLFDSMQELAGHKQWNKRHELLKAVAEEQSASFNSAVLPLDGGTLRPRHFDHVWAFFGLPGQALPSPTHRIALKELAESRNQLAHGEMSPTALGRSKTTAHLKDLVAMVEDVGENLAVAVERYVDEEIYLS